VLTLAGLLVAGCTTTPAPPPMTVGATSDPETTLLAHIYAAGLRYYGNAARVEATDDVMIALDSGKAAVAPGFTGRLLQRLDPESTARSAAGVYRAMVAALPEGIAAADYATAAEDKPAIAVTEATSTRWGSRDLSALVRNCAGLRVGVLTGDETAAAVGDCTLPPPRAYGDAASLFDALRTGSLTAAWTTTADTRVPDGVVVLVDRKPTLIPAENVVALYRRNEMNTMALRAVNEIAGVLDTVALTDMLRDVKTGADPHDVAQQWLAANPLGK
jgi:glycine betaine/choline ABC-type transport system substrate-binding protein